MLQDIGVQALSIHGRTRNQLYKGISDWTLIGEAKNNPRLHIPIIGNGDITSAEIALEMKNKYGVDGLMIGRGAIGNPWLFKEIKHLFETGEELPKPSMAERVAVCREHIVLSNKWKGEQVSLREIRKHYTNYFKGYYNIKPYRLRLVTAKSFDDVNQVLDELLNEYE
jgi:tRNA-dihydrouridine synthase